MLFVDTSLWARFDNVEPFQIVLKCWFTCMHFLIFDRSWKSSVCCWFSSKPCLKIHNFGQFWWFLDCFKMVQVLIDLYWFLHTFQCLKIMCLWLIVLYTLFMNTSLWTISLICQLFYMFQVLSYLYSLLYILIFRMHCVVTDFLQNCVWTYITLDKF